jgi:hypothetical protein
LGKRAAIGNQIEEEIIPMVPGMALVGVGRRFETAILIGPLPIRVALTLRFMAGCAILQIEALALGHLRRVEGRGWWDFLITS